MRYGGKFVCAWEGADWLTEGRQEHEVFGQYYDVSNRRGLDANGVGDVLSVTHTGATNAAYFYHYDGNGNVVRWTDTSGAVATTLDYDPFGRVLASPGPYTPRYQFSTKEYDGVVGVNYYGYEFYSPQAARLLGRTQGSGVGAPSLYAFAGSLTVHHIDGLRLSLLASLQERGHELGTMLTWLLAENPGNIHALGSHAAGELPPWIKPITPVHPHPYPGTGFGLGAHFGPVGIEWFTGHGFCCRKANTLIPQYPTKIEYRWTVTCKAKFGLGATIGLVSDPTPRDSTDCPPKDFDYFLPIDGTIPIPLPGNPTPISPSVGFGGVSVGADIGFTIGKHCKVRYTDIKVTGCCQ